MNDDAVLTKDDVEKIESEGFVEKIEKSIQEGQWLGFDNEEDVLSILLILNDVADFVLPEANVG